MHFMKFALLKKPLLWTWTKLSATKLFFDQALITKHSFELYVSMADEEPFIAALTRKMSSC